MKSDMLKKPEHIKQKRWKQHLDWMQVMKEGVFNGNEDARRREIQPLGRVKK